MEQIAGIRIDMICQDTHHPDKRQRHPGRATCEVRVRSIPVMPILGKPLRQDAHLGPRTALSTPRWKVRPLRAF